jgi:hypothetical protein
MFMEILIFIFYDDLLEYLMLSASWIGMRLSSSTTTAALLS